MQQFGDLTCEVGEDDLGAGSLDREEMFERDRGSVEPSELRRCLHHRVFAAHVIGRDRNVDVRADVGDDVEVGERRFHHDHVGAFVDIGFHFRHGFASVRRVHLVAAPVAELARVTDGAVDAITFTSSSTVTNFCDTVGALPDPQPTVVSIGPITSQTAQERGLRVDAEADPHSIDGLVEVLLATLRR